MKLFFLFSVMILFSSLIFPQSVLKENSYNLNGGFSFSASETNHPEFDSKSTSVIFNPSFSYHILDVFSIGGNISYRYSEIKINDNSGERKSITRTLNFGPTARYYFHNKNLSPFVDGSLNYSSILGEDSGGYSVSFGTGINYFFTKSIALEPKLNYIFSSYADPDYNSNTLFIGIGLNYHINE